MLHSLNELFPVRYTVFGLCVVGLLLCLFTLVGFGAGGWLLPVFLALSGLGLYDVLQTKRSILRNYPVIGHIRFVLEFVRPEMRQYFLESDTEATPFSRAQRSQFSRLRFSGAPAFHSRSPRSRWPLPAGTPRAWSDASTQPTPLARSLARRYAVCCTMFVFQISLQYSSHKM